jgi:myo-inositol-1(or 4)-monophosphatase
MIADGRDIDRTLETARVIALEAGAMALASYRLRPDIRLKGDADIVTLVDLECEALIRRRIHESFRQDRLVAEEGGASGPEAAGTPTWHIDPLDGTINYAHGHPMFSVSIALVVEAEIVLGVVHAPVLGITWTARRGGGARRNGVPVRVSTTASLSDALCASGFPHNRRTHSDDNTAEWSAMVKRSQENRRCGSAAIDLAFVADGTYDGYWEKRLNSWDLAAGVLLVREAGGRVEDIDGRPIPPWPAEIVASNGRVHDELLAVLRAAGPEPTSG